MRYSTMIVCILILCGVPVASSAGECEQPNVLFLAVDDLNDWAGYRGHDQVLSPNLDRLADDSVWFSRAYCQYPVCGPSRASVMTGMYFHQLKPEQLKIKDRTVAEKARELGSKVLHEYFHQHGYKTMAVGKLLHRHISKDGLDLSGGRGGWDEMKDQDGERIKINFKSQKTLTDWAPIKKPESAMSDSKAAAWAVERLDEKHDKPFILMVGFLRPHVPWYVPEKYFRMYDPAKLINPPYFKDDLSDVPDAALDTINDGYPRTEWAIEGGHWGDMLQAYLASITFVDQKVGLVLDALEASPYRDNTIVVLWSDHGYHMGEKNTFQKHTLWERSARVQMMIKLPASMRDASIGPGVGRCDRTVGLIDLYPTLLDLCGLPPNSEVSGRSLKPLLYQPGLAWDHPVLTYRKDGGKSIRDERFRYIEYGDGSMELYDHRVDPNEWNNTASDPAYAGALESMKKLLERNHKE
ncbi:MAG: sulfatase [Planctomycetota bacterium]